MGDIKIGDGNPIRDLSLDRRNFLQKSAWMIAAGVAAPGEFLTPAEAADRDIPLQILSDGEADRLASFAEAIVPGAKRAGVVHFVDDQLARDPNDCMLLLKYFQVRPPYVNFYRAGLAALSRYCQSRHQKVFGGLSSAEQSGIIKALIGGAPEDWDGPPAFLIYMFARSDGVDVVYGTPRGFENLGVPYMAHIAPPRGWSDD